VPSNLKRRFAIGVAVMAAAAFAGGAYAATRDSAATARQAFLNDVAKRLHVAPKQLSAALQGAAIDQLNGAVASGRLTQAQANALKQRITKGGTVPLPAGPGFGGLGPRRWFGAPVPGVPGTGGLWFRGPGPRLFGPAGRFGGPPGAHGAHHGALAAAATYLGISERQLLTQLETGKSLAQIAHSHGKAAAGLKSAITASIKAKLDTAVAAKLITSAQEQQILSRLSSRLGDVINRTGPEFGFRVPGKGMQWRPAVGASPGGPAAAAVAPLPGPTA
jgi:hypothetical protein